MGQNSSQLEAYHVSASHRDHHSQQQQKSPPPPRPAVPPQIPKIPNYAIPENRVLPLGAMELPNKRQLLRPVSQELSKFHPEFADIFQYAGDPPEDGDPAQVRRRGREDEERGRGGEDGKENVTSSAATTTLIITSPASPASGQEKGMFSSSRVPRAPANNHQTTEPKPPNTIELSRSQSLQERPRANGHVIMNGYVSSEPAGSDVSRERGGSRPGSAITRTHSLDRSSSGPLKGRGHKRFPSASTTAAQSPPSVILEDPREHLYTHWRQDPFSNPTPSSTSLPLANSFSLDYKMNLTYAQLAEHRRQKRGAQLEDRTCRKLADLNADLKEQSTVKVSPFDRKNYIPSLSQPGGSSTTGSSDTGVSKSKKRRAPPPPSTAGGAPPRDSSPGRLSLDVEPPADYDLDDPSPPLGSHSPWKSNLSRQPSNASMLSKTSTSSKGPAPKAPVPPQPPPAAGSPQQSPEPRATSLQPNGPQPAKTPNTISAQSARLIAQAKAEIEALKKLEMILKDPNTSNAQNDTTHEETEESQGTDHDRDVKEKSESDNAAIGETTSEKKETIGDAETADDAPRVHDEREQSSAPAAEAVNTDSKQPQTSADKTESDGANSPRRLSSLLQHDIVLAAQARSAKGQVKAKTPVQRVRPKDPAELFREELAKAATAREERVRSGVDLEKDKQGEDLAHGEDTSDLALVFQSNMVKVKRKPVVSESSTGEKNAADRKSLPPPVFSKPPKSPISESHVEVNAAMCKSESDLLRAQNGDRKVSGAALSRQRPPEGYPDEISPVRKAVSHDGILDISDDDDVTVPTQTSSSSRQFTQDWKPEDDLDTDDDMSDDLTYSRSSAMLESSDGFKSSIIPNKVDDLKAAKRKSSSSKSGRRESESSTDEKNKFGSIRKFQKSVHKSVKNAFGSISKASGKLLRRNKSLDFAPEEVEGMKYRVTSQDDNPPKAIVTNGTVQHFHMNGDMGVGESEEEEEDDDDDEEEEEYKDLSTQATSDQPMREMKRAGVAYVGSKGQIVVLPEFEGVPLDEDGNVMNDKDEGRAPKIIRKKKKKLGYESTVRQQERDRLEKRYAEEIREKERQIEVERRRQQDMEREFQRLRDMETQEKLQRLQTAQLQQQMNMLQQQQQQLTSMQFATPTSFQPHPHHRYSVPDFPSHHGGLYTSAGLSRVGTPVPPVNMSSYTLQSTPFVAPASTATPTTTTIAGYDVNYLSNYMRMMGIQPPSTQQQWAYLLSSIQLTPNALVNPPAKTPGMLVGSAGPDLSHLFPAKAAPPYTDHSALLAQKASLMNILNSGQLPQPGSSLATAGGEVTSSVSVPESVEVVTTSLPEQTVAPTRPKGKKTASRDDSDFMLKERTNPMYMSSEEGEEEEEEVDVTTRRGYKKASHGSTGKAKKNRPHSVHLPVVSSHSNVYRDVTLREETGVTRVHVPDYSGQDVRDNTDESDDASREEGALIHGKGTVDNGVTQQRIMTVMEEEEEAEEEEEKEGEDGFHTVQFQHRVPLSRVFTSSMSAKVYAPLGYKPVAFAPPQPRAMVQPQKSLDR